MIAFFPVSFFSGVWSFRVSEEEYVTSNSRFLYIDVLLLLQWELKLVRSRVQHWHLNLVSSIKSGA